MATKKEKYESMRIMSLEGSVLYKNEGFTALKNGKPNPPELFAVGRGKRFHASLSASFRIL